MRTLMSFVLCVAFWSSSRQDVARVAVTRQIACMVQENYAALVGGMRQVQAVDLDLARAGVQVQYVQELRLSLYSLSE